MKRSVYLKRSVYIAALSAMVVLVFAAIASAQDSTDQSSSDPNSTSTDQAQSPPPSQQEEAAPSGQAPSDQNAPTVSIAANAFDPAQVEVASGTPLTFVNDDSVAHTVSLDGLFDTPEIPAGSSYPVTLDGTGTVTYHDQANPEMQGTITVGEASQGDATTTEESADEPSQTAGESAETADGSGEPSQDSGQVDE